MSRYHQKGYGMNCFLCGKKVKKTIITTMDLKDGGRVCVGLCKACNKKQEEFKQLLGKELHEDRGDIGDGELHFKKEK